MNPSVSSNVNYAPVSVRQNGPGEDLWVIDFGDRAKSSLSISMNAAKLREVRDAITAALGDEQPEPAPRAGHEATSADVEHSTRRIAMASTNLRTLFQTRPNTMSMAEWSEKVAAVVEAARACVPFHGIDLSEGRSNALIDAVHALEGRS